MARMEVINYDKELSFLRKMSAATEKQISESPTIEAQIERVALGIFEIAPKRIDQLPKIIKACIIKRAISKNLNAKNLQKIQVYLDHEVISELLISNTDISKKVVHQYCEMNRALALHCMLDNAKIHQLLKNLPTHIKRSIIYLDLRACSRLTNLAFLADFPRLRELILSRAIALESLKGIENSPGLEKLILSKCRALRNLKGLEGNKALKILLADHCSYLMDVNTLSNCISLRELDLSYCHLLDNVEVIRRLKNLKKLTLQGLPLLQNLDFCKSLEQLYELNVEK